MSDLSVELEKNQYAGLSSVDCLALLPTQTDSLGRIEGDNKLDLLTLVITNDITERMSTKIVSSDIDLGMSSEMASACRDVARILREALDPNLILAELYRINLGLPQIQEVFAAGLSFGIITPNEHAALLLLATYKNGPDFSAVTLVQVNQAMGRYTEKEAIGYMQGRNIKITLIDALQENCVATTWAKDTVFEYENMGKLAHLKASDSIYKLRMDNKKVDGKLFVRVPLVNFNFTVELV